MKIILLFGLLAIGFQAAGQIPTLDLVGQWLFSGNAIENTGTLNNGTVYGATLTTDRCGNSNSAYLFDGDDYIECTTNDMNVSHSISISFWFKTTASNYDAMLAKYSWSADNGYTAQMDTYNSPEIRGRDGNGVFSESNTDGLARNDGEWHHFVGIVNGNTWSTWIDTAMIGSYNNGHTNVDVGACTLPLTFGRLSEPVGAGWRYYTGALDDIHIYNRAITQSEINSLFFNNCSPLAIEHISQQFDVYPNPTHNILNIERDQVDPIRIDLHDNLGRTILSKTSNQNMTQLDLSDLRPGVYFLSVKEGEKQTSFKVLRR